MGITSQIKVVVLQVWRHPANKGRRGRQLLRAVRFQLRGRVLKRRTIVPLGARSRMWGELHRTGSSRVVYANPPDWPEMLVWQRQLREGDFFVDVGANVGAYTILATELGAQVLAVEANDELVSRLRQNLALNGYDAEVLAAAATNVDGAVRFDGRGDATGHLAADGDVVPAVRLDSVIAGRRVAGMKVDVEGFERLVLEGGEQALAEGRIDLIQLEWNERSLDALGEGREPVAVLLRRCGYELFRPNEHGDLLPDADPSFGPDVFARRSA